VFRDEIALKSAVEMNVFGMANLGECLCAIAEMNSFGICLEIELQ